MSEWGHFSVQTVVQAFTAVTTAVGTIIKIPAPGPPECVGLHIWRELIRDCDI